MHNLQSSFQSLYAHANHSIEKFGSIVLANAASDSQDFNLIFNLNSFTDTAENEKSLEAALVAANKVKKPFLYVQYANIKHSPKNLLSKHKFKHIGQVTCVSMKHEAWQPTGNTNQNYKIQRVNTSKLFNDWCKIMDLSFSLVTGATKQVFYPALSYLFGEDALHHLYILHDEMQTPISSSLLYLPKGTYPEAGLYCGGTKAAYRNKGAMSFLVSEMVTIAKKNAFKTSVAQCYDTSLRLVQKIGFQSGGVLDIFSNNSSH